MEGQGGIQGDETAHGTARADDRDQLTDPAQTEDGAQHHHGQRGREDEEVGDPQLQSRGDKDHKSRCRQPDDQGTAGNAAVAEEGRAPRLIGRADDGPLVDGEDQLLLGLLFGLAPRAARFGFLGFLACAREVGGMLVMLHG